MNEGEKNQNSIIIGEDNENYAIIQDDGTDGGDTDGGGDRVS